MTGLQRGQKRKRTKFDRPTKLGQERRRLWTFEKVCEDLIADLGPRSMAAGFVRDIRDNHLEGSFALPFEDGIDRSTRRAPSTAERTAVLDLIEDEVHDDAARWELRGSRVLAAIKRQRARLVS